MACLTYGATVSCRAKFEAEKRAAEEKERQLEAARAEAALQKQRQELYTHAMQVWRAFRGFAYICRLAHSLGYHACILLACLLWLAFYRKPWGNAPQ